MTLFQLALAVEERVVDRNLLRQTTEQLHEKVYSNVFIYFTCVFLYFISFILCSQIIRAAEGVAIQDRMQCRMDELVLANIMAQTEIKQHERYAGIYYVTSCLFMISESILYGVIMYIRDSSDIVKTDMLLGEKRREEDDMVVL